MGYASAAERKRWRIERERGLSRLTDVEPVREHLADLMALGFTGQGIGTVAGVDQTTISRIMRGKLRTLRLPTAKALMMVTPQRLFAEVGDGTKVPAYATVRRIQALQVVGWRTDELERRAGGGRHLRGISPLRTVHASVHRRVKALYEELETSRGDSDLNVMRATIKGYRAPLDWDDIEDPNEDPRLGFPDAEEGLPYCARYIDHVAIAKRLAGLDVFLGEAERHWVIIHGHEDRSDTALKSLLSCGASVLSKHRREHSSC